MFPRKSSGAPKPTPSAQGVPQEGSRGQQAGSTQGQSQFAGVARGINQGSNVNSSVSLVPGASIGRGQPLPPPPIPHLHNPGQRPRVHFDLGQNQQQVVRRWSNPDDVWYDRSDEANFRRDFARDRSAQQLSQRLNLPGIDNPALGIQMCQMRLASLNRRLDLSAQMLRQFENTGLPRVEQLQGSVHQGPVHQGSAHSAASLQGPVRGGAQQGDRQHSSAVAGLANLPGGDVDILSPPLLRGSQSRGISYSAGGEGPFFPEIGQDEEQRPARARNQDPMDVPLPSQSIRPRASRRPSQDNFSQEFIPGSLSFPSAQLGQASTQQPLQAGSSDTQLSPGSPPGITGDPRQLTPSGRVRMPVAHRNNPALGISPNPNANQAQLMPHNFSQFQGMPRNLNHAQGIPLNPNQAQGVQFPQSDRDNVGGEGQEFETPPRNPGA